MQVVDKECLQRLALEKCMKTLTKVMEQLSSWRSQSTNVKRLAAVQEVLQGMVKHVTRPPTHPIQKDREQMATAFSQYMDMLLDVLADVMFDLKQWRSQGSNIDRLDEVYEVLKTVKEMWQE